MVDPVRLRQILANGLSNAVKYARASAPVLVSVRLSDGRATAAAAAAPSADDMAHERAGAAEPGDCFSTVTMHSPVAAPHRSSSCCAHLLIEVLDTGGGLRGVPEETLFSDFAAIGGGGGVGEAAAAAAARNGRMVIGSSGLGLPIIARLAKCVVTHTALAFALLCFALYDFGARASARRPWPLMLMLPFDTTVHVA